MRRTQSLLLAIIALALTASVALADDTLPPTRQLIKDALALCNDPEEKYGSIHSMLAESYVNLGDIAAARAILGEYKNDFWNQAGYQGCAALEAELFGSVTMLPATLWKDDPDFTHWRLAQAYAKRGDVRKALEHANGLSVGPATILHLSGRRLVDLLLASGDRKAARDVLIRRIGCFAGAKSIDIYHRPEVAVEHDVKLLIEFGEAERARSLCQHWQQIAERETDIDEWGEFIGMSWARLGASWAATGENEKAASALGKAREWLDKAKGAELDPMRDLHHLEYAVSYAVVASRQRLALAPDAARDSYERAYESAALTTATAFQDFGYVKIAREQLKAGDLNSIPETMKRMMILRHRAEGWREISKHYLEQGDKQGSLTVARAAAAELDRDDLETAVARETANIAECLAKAGDVEFAQRLFRRAIALSDRHEDPKFDHQWIACQQVGAGLLA